MQFRVLDLTLKIKCIPNLGTSIHEGDTGVQASAMEVSS